MSGIKQKNAFLFTYTRRIENLLNSIELFQSRGTYNGDLNLNECMAIIRGACTEINILQSKVDSLEKALNESNENLKNIKEQHDRVTAKIEALKK